MFEFDAYSVSFAGGALFCAVCAQAHIRTGRQHLHFSTPILLAATDENGILL